MKKIALLAFVLVLLSTTVVVGFIGSVEASGTITIKADGSIEGTTHISTGDNVTYTFTGNINDSIVVERDNIVVNGVGYTLQGSGSGTGIDLTYRSNVTIKNMKIKEFVSGISLSSDSSNNRIYQNDITNNWHGIYLLDSSNNLIFGNNVTNNEYGIGNTEYDSGGSNNIIFGNNVSKNEKGIFFSYASNNILFKNDVTNNGWGIYLSYSSNNLLRGNSIVNNTYNFDIRIYSPWSVVNDVDTSNTVDGKPIYYWVNKRNMSAPLNAGYIVLVNCTDITVKNLNLTNNGQGILLAYTTNSTITGNHLTNNYHGMAFWNTIDSKIENNTAKNNQYGIKLGNSKNNRLINNNVSSNYLGISISDSDNNILSNNVASSNHIGISLFESNNNELSGNIASDNWGTFGTDGSCGIGITYSNSNTLTNNMVTDNFQGISLDYSDENTVISNDIKNNIRTGIRMRFSNNNLFSGNTIENSGYAAVLGSSGTVAESGVGIWLESSSNNKIFNNNFINTKPLVYSGSWFPNIWDNGYPSGGNYWSSYNGTDNNQDGIGDTPYVIDENNQDNYPLMTPSSPPPVEEVYLPPPFGINWWSWTIVTVIVVALAGAVYFLKKRKPPTPAVSTLPIEGT